MKNVKKGDSVVQVQPKPIEGVVVGFGLCQETGTVSVKVQYTDADDEVHERYFKQDEVTLIEPTEQGS